MERKPGRLRAFLGLLFAPHCMICGERTEEEEEDWICGECAEGISHISSPMCLRCGMPFVPESGVSHYCQNCLLTPPLFGTARALGRYDEGLRKAIVRFKYEGRINVGLKLGKRMAAIDFPGLVFGEYDVIVPVPLHPRRLKERGFNQAVVLASQLSGRHRVPLDVLTLRRSRPTESQINLGFKERRMNVKGAFEVRNAEKVKKKRLLLVDDVYTSGATVHECTKALLRAGAKRVDVLTLARAV